MTAKRSQEKTDPTLVLVVDALDKADPLKALLIDVSKKLTQAT